MEKKEIGQRLKCSSRRKHGAVQGAHGEVNKASVTRGKHGPYGWSEHSLGTKMGGGLEAGGLVPRDYPESQAGKNSQKCDWPEEK